MNELNMTSKHIVPLPHLGDPVFEHLAFNGAHLLDDLLLALGQLESVLEGRQGRFLGL